MILVEVIGNQYLRILALEETVGKLQTDNSLLQEKVMKLTPQLDGSTKVAADAGSASTEASAA
jgi:hypothetical protein